MGGTLRNNLLEYVTRYGLDMLESTGSAPKCYLKLMRIRSSKVQLGQLEGFGFFGALPHHLKVSLLRYSKTVSAMQSFTLFIFCGSSAIRHHVCGRLHCCGRGNRQWFFNSLFLYCSSFFLFSDHCNCKSYLSPRLLHSGRAVHPLGYPLASFTVSTCATLHQRCCHCGAANYRSMAVAGHVLTGNIWCQEFLSPEQRSSCLPIDSSGNWKH